MSCSNLKNNGYWSSTLDSRHDCSSSVCCPCGGWVNLHNDELFYLRDRSVPICEWTKLLVRRDLLESSMLGMGNFIFSDGARYDRIVPVLHLLDSAKLDMGSKETSYPPMVLLHAAIMSRKWP